MYEEMDDVVRGVGQVCISASSLEWSLAYCTSVLRCKGDDWFVNVFASPSQPLKQFRKLTSALAARMPELRADTEQLLATAEQLLAQRHRVVHSAMMGELDPDSRACEAWHAKTDAMWSVVPADLNSLAREHACPHLLPDPAEPDHSASSSIQSAGTRALPPRQLSIRLSWNQSSTRFA